MSRTGHLCAQSLVTGAAVEFRTRDPSESWKAHMYYSGCPAPATCGPCVGFTHRCPAPAACGPCVYFTQGAARLRRAAHAEAGDGPELAVVPDVERVVVHVGAPQPLQRGRGAVDLRARAAAIGHSEQRGDTPQRGDVFRQRGDTVQ
jgi:hypothetical protein